MQNTLEKDTLEESLIKLALDEDFGDKGDITTDSVIPQDKLSKFNLILNEDAILGGFDVFCKTFKLIDNEIKIISHFNDGNSLKASSEVAQIEGSVKNILKGERTALNFLSHLSGIATCTKLLVDLIKDTNVVLLDTRKTTPNLRCFEKKAVLSGGGANHRLNLSEAVLIKDNHIAQAGGVTNAILNVRRYYPDKMIEIEVENLQELKEAIKYTPDVIMFDNWNVQDLREAMRLVPDDMKTEVSGQITPNNILEYARLGVNYISTSYMIKNAKWVDFSLKS